MTPVCKRKDNSSTSNRYTSIGKKGGIFFRRVKFEQVQQCAKKQMKIVPSYININYQAFVNSFAVDIHTNAKVVAIFNFSLSFCFILSRNFRVYLVGADATANTSIDLIRKPPKYMILDSKFCQYSRSILYTNIILRPNCCLGRCQFGLVFFFEGEMKRSLQFCCKPKPLDLLYIDVQVIDYYRLMGNAMIEKYHRHRRDHDGNGSYREITVIGTRTATTARAAAASDGTFQFLCFRNGK